MKIPVGPPTITIFADDEVLVSDQNARISSQQQLGYFAADTRLVSGYRVWLGRAAPVLLNTSDVEASPCRFEFVNANVHTDRGWSEFGDIFEVKTGRRVRRGHLEAAWDAGQRRLTTTYVNGTFRRGLSSYPSLVTGERRRAGSRVAVSSQIGHTTGRRNLSSSTAGYGSGMNGRRTAVAGGGLVAVVTLGLLGCADDGNDDPEALPAPERECLHAG